MKIRAFITQKKAEKPSDCQDRFAVNKQLKIAAVSDGVSQSIFPDLWANLLVEHYTSFGHLSEQDRLDLCQKWKNLVLKYIEDEKSKGNNPWRTESNLVEGISAGATLCGVKFDDNAHWTCEVLGDSCLIKAEKESIEIISSEEKAFDTYPDYLDSNPIKKGRGTFRSIEGDLSNENKLILVSDPFSDFFYKLKDDSRKYVDELLSVKSHNDFILLVEKWRNLGMHNDDSTVVIIEWDGSMAFNLDYVDDLTELIKAEKQDEKTQANVSNSQSEVHIQEKNETESDLSEEPFEDGVITTAKDEKNDTNLGVIKEELPSSSNEIILQDKETKKPELESESIIVATDNKNCDKDVIEKLRGRMLEHIPSFLDTFMSKEELRKYSGLTTIIRFIFNGKKKRIQELRTLLECALESYVKSFK